MNMQTYPTTNSVLLPEGGIDMTKVLKSAVGSLAWLEQMLVEITLLVEVLQNQIIEDAPKVDFYNEVAENSHLFDIDEGAKIAKSGRTRMFTYLRKHQVLKGGARKNIPYQKYLDAGLFEVKHLQYRNRKTGELSLKSMPFFTGKGLEWLHAFIEKHGRDGL